MQTFSIDGQLMRYLDIGQGEVLVFGHSYLWDSNMWQPQLDVLSQHYRCIVPDFWGHGQSDPAPASMQCLADYASHVLQLMDHLSIPAFSLIGFSLGGLWASELTAMAPERVKSMVLMNSFVGLEPEVMHAKYHAMLSTIRVNQAFPSVLIDQIVSLFFCRYSIEANLSAIDDFRQHLAGLRQDAALEIAHMGKMMFNRRDQFEAITQFTLPVLIMAGADDQVRTVLESYLMQDSIPGSEFVTTPSTGHMSPLEQPALVIQTLQQFFAKTLSRA